MICVSVAEPTVEQALDTLRQVSGADLCEIRLDALEEPRLKPFLEHRERLLFTFRAREEGGFREVPLERRLALLREAAAAGAAYVDLELRSGPEAVAELRRACRKTRLLLSYHHFSHTPSEAYLRDKVLEMRHLGADVGKVVCMARTLREAYLLPGLILWAREKLDFPLIAFAMGPLGKWTRAVCLLLGSPFTYVAARPGGQTAPGQLTLEELRTALQVFREEGP